MNLIFDHDSDQEEGSQVDSEEALEEEVSEVEDDTKYNPEKKDSDTDEEDPAEAVVSFQSKNTSLSWMSSPPERRGRVPSENVIRMTPGPTHYVIYPQWITSSHVFNFSSKTPL